MAEGATPMMKQYHGLRLQIPRDALLLFRLGDFYELFFEDAETGSRLLNLTLTRRNGVPMCGLPYHASDGYVTRLLQAGRRVAICDQVSEAKPGQMVERAITRILSPGCAVGVDLAEPKSSRWLASAWRARNKAGAWGFALLDATTGDFRLAEPADEVSCREEVRRAEPAELLLEEEEKKAGDWVDSGVTLTRVPDWTFEEDTARRMLCEHFRVQSLDGFGCRGLGPAVGAAGALLRYLTETLKGAGRHLQPPKPFRPEDCLRLDAATQRNLELLSPAGSGSDTSLLRAIDQTVTAMGGREIRAWIQQPLRKAESIQARHEAVEGFLADAGVLDDFRESLREVRDLARLLGRLSTPSGSARDLGGLRLTLEALPRVRDLAKGAAGRLNRELADRIEEEPELAGELARGIVDEPPAMAREGGMIRDGFDAQLDDYRKAMREGRNWIADLQAREMERTGIKSLKIRYNQVFGYGIEVTKSYLDRVPGEYERKQTLAQAERFVTKELKEMEAKILGAEEKALGREAELFASLREKVLARTARLQETARAVGSLDALAGLATTARLWHYVRPKLADHGRIRIVQGRHPVVEQILAGGADPFVPNDLRLGGSDGTLMVLTGPNMAGKSTFLRQAALICLLNQIGSFVPAREAELPVLDRIFTRIGAGDDLARGQSTFLVEMNETALILHNATEESLVILDEIGRGTSTLDGLSIAWAVGEHLHDKVKAKTLFATHYHELTELALTRSGARNFRVDVREEKDRVVFLRRIVEGGADRSYGIQVARLAGLPGDVLRRAEEILKGLEAGELNAAGKPARIRPPALRKPGKPKPEEPDLFA